MEAMTQTDIKAIIKEYILREFMPGESPDTLDDSVMLISGYILDSIGTAKLGAFLEQTFGIQLEPHEMSAEYLNSLPDIARIVEWKRAAK